MFNTSEISTLLKIIKDADFDDVELKAGDLYIRVRTGGDDEFLVTQPAVVESDIPARNQASEQFDDDVDLFDVRSPTVGTFYTASAPGAEPFVKVGDRVSATQQVALVEVMKLFNAVEAGVNGTVVAIRAQDAQMVEYGDVLITIRPDNS